MWSFGVVVFPPFLDDDVRFSERVEDFTVKQLVSHPSVKAFTISVLPRRPWLDLGCLCTDHHDPVPDRLCNKLRAIVRSSEGWCAPKNEQITQSIDHICRVQFSLHPDRQTFPAVLVQHVQFPEELSVFGPTVNEVIGPDMVLILWSQPNA